MVFDNLVSAQDSPEILMEPEIDLMRTLTILMYNATDKAALVAIAEELTEQSSECNGPSHPITADLVSSLGSAYQNMQKTFEANKLFSIAIRKLRRADRANAKDVADLLRDLAMSHSQTDLGKAFNSKGRSIEQQFGLKSAQDFAMQMLLQVMGSQPEPDMVPEDADRLIEEWLSSEENNIEVPFVQLEVSREERLKRLIPLFERTQAQADLVEANDSYPLCRISTLSQLSGVLVELGDIERGQDLLRQEIVLLKNHWGVEHDMTKDAIEQLEKLG